MAIKSEIFKRKEKLEIQNMRRDKDNKTNFKKRKYRKENRKSGCERQLITEKGK